jgi:hypothetical protein
VRPAVEARVADRVLHCVLAAVPKPAVRQLIRYEINAAAILSRTDFVEMQKDPTGSSSSECLAIRARLPSFFCASLRSLFSRTPRYQHRDRPVSLLVSAYLTDSAMSLRFQRDLARAGTHRVCPCANAGTAGSVRPPCSALWEKHKRCKLPSRGRHDPVAARKRSSKKNLKRST